MTKLSLGVIVLIVAVPVILFLLWLDSKRSHSDKPRKGSTDDWMSVYARGVRMTSKEDDNTPTPTPTPPPSDSSG